MIQVARRSDEDTRTRKHNCDKLQELADLAGVEVDLKPYRGSYSQYKTRPRELPSDAAIAQIQAGFLDGRKQVEASCWQWAYGVMAAYGLRDHEIFFCEISAEPPYQCRF